jgi:hypothetical protein
MEKIYNDIQSLMIVFSKEMQANVNGNKAAGARARKASLEL